MQLQKCKRYCIKGQLRNAILLTANLSGCNMKEYWCKNHAHKII